MVHYLGIFQSWLAAGGHTISGLGWILLLVLLLIATIILNSVTEASDYRRMAVNFATLLIGATLGSLCFPDVSPPLDLMANYSSALFSGMTIAALVNLAILRPL